MSMKRTKRVNLVFNGFPGPGIIDFDGPDEEGPGCFIEAEDFETGRSTGVGYWWKREDGFWVLTLMVGPIEEHFSSCSLHHAPAYAPQRCDCGVWVSTRGYINVVPTSETLEEIQAMQLSRTNREEVKEWLSKTVRVVIPPDETFILIGQNIITDQPDLGDQMDIVDVDGWIIRTGKEVDILPDEEFARTYMEASCNISHCAIEEHSE